MALSIQICVTGNSEADNFEVTQQIVLSVVKDWMRERQIGKLW